MNKPRPFTPPRQSHPQTSSARQPARPGPYLRPASSSAHSPASSCSRQQSPTPPCGPKLRQCTAGSSSAGFSLAVRSVASTSARLRMAPVGLRKRRQSTGGGAGRGNTAERLGGRRRRGRAVLILWLPLQQSAQAGGAGGCTRGCSESAFSSALCEALAPILRSGFVCSCIQHKWLFF